MGCHTILQGIFPTQGLNTGLPHCRWILYQLSHKGSPKILEIPSPGDLPDPGIEPGSPALQADSYQLSYQISPNLSIFRPKFRLRNSLLNLYKNHPIEECS